MSIENAVPVFVIKNVSFWRDFAIVFKVLSEILKKQKKIQNKLWTTSHLYTVIALSNKNIINLTQSHRGRRTSERFIKNRVIIERVDHICRPGRKMTSCLFNWGAIKNIDNRQTILTTGPGSHILASLIGQCHSLSFFRLTLKFY